MFYLMAEIDGILVRVGHHTKIETRAIDSALNCLHCGYCGKTIRYVEVWQRLVHGNKLMWSSMLAGL